MIIPKSAKIVFKKKAKKTSKISMGKSLEKKEYRLDIAKCKEKNTPIKKRKIYQGKLLTLEEEFIRFEGKIFQREIVKHPSAVAILPIDKNGKAILIRQYRKAIDEILIEIPAGILEKGENILSCAQRELQEEIGYKANKLTFLGSFYTSPGFCNEIIHLFLAEDLKKNKLDGDLDEDIELMPVSLKKVEEMIRNQTIQDAKTIMAFHLHFLFHEKKLR
jgi:ADP-ribose pyrophosphatase